MTKAKHLVLSSYSDQQQKDILELGADEVAGLSIEEAHWWSKTHGEEMMMFLSTCFGDPGVWMDRLEPFENNPDQYAEFFALMFIEEVCREQALQMASQA